MKVQACASFAERYFWNNARLLPSVRIDPQDVGAIGGQETRCNRSRKDAGQIENTELRKRPRRTGCPRRSCGSVGHAQVYKGLLGHCGALRMIAPIGGRPHLRGTTPGVNDCGLELGLRPDCNTTCDVSSVTVSSEYPLGGFSMAGRIRVKPDPT